MTQAIGWLAYERLEPFVADRIDANATHDRWRNHRQNGGKSENPKDFRLLYGRRPKRETAAQKIARIQAGFASLTASMTPQRK